MDISADPSNPEPGGSATIQVTVSGEQGINRFGAPGVPVALALSEKPKDDATIDPAKVTTDNTGTATARLRLSTQRGRHIVTASFGSLTASLTIDTAVTGSDQPTRAHHRGLLDPLPQVTRSKVSPVPLFAAAALVLVGGFSWPYISRIRRKPGSARRSSEVEPAAIEAAQAPASEAAVVEASAPALFTLPVTPVSGRVAAARRAARKTTTLAATAPARRKSKKDQLRPAQPRQRDSARPARRVERPDVTWTN